MALGWDPLAMPRYTPTLLRSFERSHLKNQRYYLAQQLCVIPGVMTAVDRWQVDILTTFPLMFSLPC